MIEIRSFKEMVSLQQAGRVPFRILQEIAAVLLALSDYDRDIPEPVEINVQQVDWLLNQQEDIDLVRYMGGWLYICETEEDLKQVTTIDWEFGKQYGRNSSVTEMTLNWDTAKYLVEADGTADYALLFSCTNNAGGISWIVPKNLYQAAQIDKQIEANQQSWGVTA